MDTLTVEDRRAATVWGGLLIVVSHPLRLVVGGTPAWLWFATWLTSWVD